MNTNKRSYIISLITGIVLTILLCLGEYWNFNDGMIQELVFIAASVFLVLIVPFVISRNQKASTAVSQFYLNAKKRFSLSAEDKKRIIHTFLIYTGAILASIVLSLVCSRIVAVDYNYILQATVLTIVLILVSVFVYKEDIVKKPEKVFAITAFIAGVFFISVTPTEVGICWDDNYHYDGTIAMLTVNGAYYESDAVIIDNVAEVALEKKGYDRQTRTERDQLINSLYAEGVIRPENHANLGANTIAYIPFGIGLLIGRGLHLPYTVTFRLEKLCNLLFYITVFYFAIRRVRSGKILLASIGLMPTNLFLAGSFSYDPWITALTVLGFAWFFSYLQDAERKLTTKDMIIMFGAFTLACIPKALYFILMFPLAFMPVSRFASGKQRIVYYICGVTIAFLLASTFAWPILSQIIKNIISPGTETIAAVAGTADAELAQGGRGGSAGDQIAYIMQDPMHYMKILFSFLTQVYINPLSSPQYAANYAYLGFGKAVYTAPIVLALVTFFDRDGMPQKSVPVLLSTIFAVCCLLVLIPTSLYIYYTTIGGQTIEGCQHRYLIPLLYPILYVNGFDRLRNRISPYIFNLLPMLVMALLFVCNIGMILYSLY